MFKRFLFNLKWFLLKKRLMSKPPLENTGWAAILIDMQKEFVDRLPDGTDKWLIPNQIRVLNYCKQKEIPIIVLEYKGEGRTLSALLRHLHDHRPVARVIKSADNGFINTQLEEILMRINASKIFIMGINAGACVLSTAEGAKKRGYTVATSLDVIAGESAESSSWYKKNTIVQPISSLA